MRSRPTILASASALGAELQPEGGAELLAGRCYSGELGRGGMGVWVPDGRRALWTDPSRDPRVVSCFAHCCRSACGAGRGTGQAPHGAPVDARVQENVQCAARRGAAGMSRVPLYRSAIPGNDSRNYPRFAHPGAGALPQAPSHVRPSDSGECESTACPPRAPRAVVRRARAGPAGAGAASQEQATPRGRNRGARYGWRISSSFQSVGAVASEITFTLESLCISTHGRPLRAARVRDATSIELANN